MENNCTQCTSTDSLELLKATFVQANMTLEVEYNGVLEPECEFSSNNEIVAISDSTCITSANNTLKLHFVQVKKQWDITETRVQFKFSWSTGNTCPVYTVLYDYETSKCHETIKHAIMHRYIHTMKACTYVRTYMRTYMHMHVCILNTSYTKHTYVHAY